MEPLWKLSSWRGENLELSDMIVLSDQFDSYCRFIIELHSYRHYIAQCIESELHK